MKFPGYLTWLFWPVILVICLIGDYRAINGLTHFVPDKGWELIGIEFDYPKEWVWIHKSESTFIYTYDPEYPPIRRDIWIKGPVVQRTGMISIHVRVSRSPETMSELIDSYLEATERIGAQILEDKVVDIDGVSARWLTRWGPDDPCLSEDFDTYDIYVVFYAKSIVYSIYMITPYDDRDNDFVKGFEDMIASIRFTP